MYNTLIVTHRITLLKNKKGNSWLCNAQQSETLLQHRLSNS